ncbi:TonB-dependent hemoglobin/transferrin/lactoferrin family receptor [Pseudomonas sp.]|jgi:heme acquisition protein HasR|uniref:TonB-dependent hemoglobin/transferrin/lactoferrin family receptor n=1 Tax=Pseudomonas sp. TaxID=306 RepID=UPI0037C85869
MSHCSRLQSGRLAGGLVLGIALALASSVAVGGQTVEPSGQVTATRVVDFDIAAQALDRAALAFAEQAGIQVFFDSERLQGLQASPLRGRYLLGEGLQQLLRGVPVNYRFTGPAQVTLTRRAEGDVTLQLSPATVRGARLSERERLFRRASSADLIEREAIDKLPPRHSADLFVGTPGVQVAEDRRNPGVAVNVRGLQDFGRVNMMIDGARQNYQQSGHGANGQAYVDPELLRSVEIEKGPNSGVGGAGVIGGMVNFRTIDAADLVTDGRNIGGQINASSGFGGYRNGMHFSGSAAVGVSVHDRYDLLLALGSKSLGQFEPGQRGEFDPDGDGTAMRKWVTQFTRQDQDSRLAKLGVNLSEDQRVQLGYTELKADFESSSTNDMRSFDEVTSRTWVLDHNWSPASDLLDLQTKLSYAEVVNQHERPARGTYGAFDVRYQTNTLGASLANTSRFTLGDAHLSWNYGGEYYYDWTDPEAIQAKRQADEEDYTAAFDGATPKGERWLGSLFSQVRMEYAHWLEANIGLRYDYYHLWGDSSYYMGKGRGRLMTEIPFCNTPFGQGMDLCYTQKDVYQDIAADQRQGQFSPTFGLAVKPIEAVQLFANFGKGWRPPAITETLMHGVHVGGFGAPFTPNPELAPERSTNWEVGGNLLLDDLLVTGDKLRGKLAYYSNKVDDYVVNGVVVYPSLTGQGLPWLGVNQPHTVASGWVNLTMPVRFRGYEASLDYDSGGFYLKGSYTRTDLHYLGDYDPLQRGAHPLFRGELARDGIPGKESLFFVAPARHRAALDSGIRLFEQSLTLGGRVRYNSATRGASGPTAELNFTSARIYDLYASYEATDALTLRLSVENLRDSLYATPLGLGGVRVGAGRTSVASVNLKF